MVILWRIEERCNLACAFCGYSKALERPRRSTPPAEVLRVIELLAGWRRASGERVLLSWLGGEPFLRRDLPELTRHAVSRGLAVSTTTNGTTLGSPALRRHVLDCYAELTLSVDGLETFHDRVRGLPGSFALLRDGAHALVTERRTLGRGPLLRVNSVLMRDNARDFPALAREVASWGIDELSVNQLGGVERPEFHREHALGPNDVDFLEATWPELRAELARSGVRLLGGAAHLGRMRATARGTSLPIADCRPGERFLFLDEQGRISPCCFTSGELGVPVAAVSDFAEVPARLRTARRERLPRACGDCMSTQTSAKFELA